jgi:soluble lytic murein transglycosylase-like protein
MSTSLSGVLSQLNRSLIVNVLSQNSMVKGVPAAACILLTILGLSATPVRAQIASVVNEDGKRLFINAEGQLTVGKRKPASPPGRTTIYLPGASPLSWRSIPGQTPVALRDYDRIVHQAAERHSVDPALVRAVIQTESNWNPAAVSRKGAVGLMQLVPGTAKRLGVSDVRNPEHNVDGGVHYLRLLLDRYNGNLDLALAAYNAGEGAVDRARGVPAFRETRNYVQKVTEAYFRPGSGRLANWWEARHPIHKETDERGRVVFTNE